MHRNRVSGSWLLCGALLLSSCATVKSHWPFGKPVQAAPQPVSELELKFPAETAFPVLQFWERNTLVIDLTTVAGAGQVVLARRADHDWPARLAVRMAPQRFEVLEVRGAQRLVLPVANTATAAVTAALPRGLYDVGTSALTISWGAKGAF